MPQSATVVAIAPVGPTGLDVPLPLQGAGTQVDEGAEEARQAWFLFAPYGAGIEGYLTPIALWAFVPG